MQDVGTQAVVTEYLIRYVELIFNDKIPPMSHPGALETPKRGRPKSLAISTPTKLLTIEEARLRALTTAIKPDQKYIEVGQYHANEMSGNSLTVSCIVFLLYLNAFLLDCAMSDENHMWWIIALVLFLVLDTGGGPQSLPKTYHTVIELPSRKGGSLKQKKSPLGWKSIFSKGRAAPKQQRKISSPCQLSLTLPAVSSKPEVSACVCLYILTCSMIKKKIEPVL